MSKAVHFLQQFQQERVNPEFIGISQRYIEHRKQRRSIEMDKTSLGCHVKHLEKLNTSLASNLSRKSLQLRYLKQVRERYSEDMRKKLQKAEQNNNKFERLKQKCMKSKTDSIQSIQDALSSMKHKKQILSNEVKNTLSQLKKQYSLKKSRIDQYNQDLLYQVQHLKSHDKKRMNKNLQKKNTLLLKSYKSQIRKEESLSKYALQEIETLKSREHKFKSKIQNKEVKLAQITKQIEQLKNGEVRNIQVDQKWNSQMMIHVPSES